VRLGGGRVDVIDVTRAEEDADEVTADGCDLTRAPVEPVIAARIAGVSRIINRPVVGAEPVRAIHWRRRDGLAVSGMCDGPVRISLCVDEADAGDDEQSGEEETSQS